jgi:DNA repair photolyase
MGLNKQKGNMYAHVSHTWNAIKGRCSHDCHYCYMRAFKLGPLKLDNSEFQTGLGEGNYIFVGSSTDMFAENVPSEWIESVLSHCRKYPENKYLFQSKNPLRFFDFYLRFPPKSIACTTIETNRDVAISKSPAAMFERAECMRELRFRGLETQVTVEPILDFDKDDFVELLQYAQPALITIGADSKGHTLPEPSPQEIKLLIAELQQFTQVIIKQNLRRLLK